MPAFALTDEQHTYLRQVREVAAAELVPLAEQGVEGAVNRPLLEAMGRHGLLARLFGNSGRSAAAMELCLLREALAEVCTDAETALALQALGSYPLLLFGTEGSGRALPRRGGGRHRGGVLRAV